MNKITTFITTALMLFSITAFSQTKEETVKYINDLYIKSTGKQEEKVSLDGKTLVRTVIDPVVTTPIRTHLTKNEGNLIIKNCAGGEKCIFFRKGDDAYSDVFTGLWGGNDEDSKRLKNALEHLIKLLKAEPEENDPFTY